jgi:hypothetical protein
MKPTCILALGPSACVMNALPLAHQIFTETGEKPAFAVSRACAHVLESVTYVEPLVIDGDPMQIRGPMDSLAQKYTVKHCQPFGHGYMVPNHVGQSWAEEAYNTSGAGMHSRFCDGQFETLVLDKRFDEEEAQIIAEQIGSDPRPIILVSLANGVGGPEFPFAAQAIDLIGSRFGTDCHVINITGMRAARVGNLLGLFERASFLVTADNPSLHLAAAVPTLPYIAFVQHLPTLWHGSYTRGKCLLRIRYDQFTYWPFAICKLIDAAIRKPERPVRLVHAYYVPANVSYDTYRRDLNAHRTWKAAHTLGSFLDVPVRPENAPRRFRDNDRDMIFVNDLIQVAYDKCDLDSGKDAILLCNSDSCFSVEMYDKIAAIFQSGVEGFCGPRRDFNRLEEALYPSQIIQGVDYVGTDIVVLRPSWWEKHKAEFPDMVLGAEAWDCVMRWQMIHRDKLPFVRDLVYHEKHSSRWEERHNINTLPSQRHNLTVAIQALEELNAKHGFNWKPGMFGIHPQRLGAQARPQTIQASPPQSRPQHPGVVPRRPGVQTFTVPPRTGMPAPNNPHPWPRT